ncbi:uncharacterized protein [Ptychodera flava]|uniref:uncharacterized protein n=1 Tax=Ptychodera flava TaxID=63121 RepID=UPI00396A961A
MATTHDRSVLFLLIPLIVATLALPIGIGLSFMVMKNGILTGIGYCLLTVGAGSIVFLAVSAVFIGRYRKKYIYEDYKNEQRRRSSADAKLQEQKVSMLNANIASQIEKGREEKSDWEQLPVFKLQPPPPGRKKRKQECNTEDQRQNKPVSMETSKQNTKTSHNNNNAYVILPSHWKHIDNVKKLSQQVDVNTYGDWILVDNANPKRYSQRSDSTAKQWTHVDNVKCKRISPLKRLNTYCGEEQKQQSTKTRRNRAESV